RLSRDHWIYRHDIWYADDAGDWRDVAKEIEAELIIERHIDGVRRSRQEERIAVRRARTTASVPILLPAPGRFSMMNGWPSRSESHWPIRRAVMSLAPAGATGTIRRTGATGRLAPARSAAMSVARLRPRPDAEIVYGGEVSFEPPSASHHSITSSARASILSGISMPSVFAVLTLITSSNFVGSITGRSPGFSPLRMRLAYMAACRYRFGILVP